VTAIFGQQIVRLIVDAAITVIRAVPAAFAGMVIHYVEPNFDASEMKRIHHGAEFLRRPVAGLAGRVIPVGREEVERHVPPKTSLLRIALVHRHQFHGGDSQAFQVGNLLGQACESAAVTLAHAGVRARRETLDVQFVDDQIVGRPWRPFDNAVWRERRTRKHPQRRTAVVRARRYGCHAAVAGRKVDGRSERVEQNLLWIETIPDVGIAAAFHPICVVSRILRVIRGDPAMPDAARLVKSGVQSLLEDRPERIFGSIEQERDARGAAGVKRKIPRAQSRHPCNTHRPGSAFFSVPFVKARA